MSAHTPGPWQVYSHAPFSVWADKDVQVATCRVLDEKGDLASPYLVFSWDTAEANARLIAAAPRMLEALESGLAAVTYLETILNTGAQLGLTGTEWIAFADKARAAIAQAKEGKR